MGQTNAPRLIRCWVGETSRSGGVVCGCADAARTEPRSANGSASAASLNDCVGLPPAMHQLILKSAPHEAAWLTYHYIIAIVSYCFTAFQAYEHLEAPFTISESGLRFVALGPAALPPCSGRGAPRAQDVTVKRGSSAASSGRARVAPAFYRFYHFYRLVPGRRLRDMPGVVL